MTIKNQVSRTVLAICCVLVIVGCDQPVSENKPKSSTSQSGVVKAKIPTSKTERTATIYSFDNPKIKPEGSIGAFPSTDPRHMTIALQSQPGAKSKNADTIRFFDPGQGVAAKILAQQEWLGNRWYEVEAQGHIGWIAEQLIILDRP